MKMQALTQTGFAMTLLALATSVQADTLQVITSGGFASTLVAMEKQLEQDTGLEIEISFGSSSGGAHDSIPERLKRQEQFDVVILSKKSLNTLTKKGFVQADTRTDLVNSLIGMSVKAGAPKPDISTKENFIKVLKEAESIGYSASASGTYLSTTLWPQMGIWEEIKPKSKRVLSERVATVVARGELEIGFQQVSEILTIPGSEFVGTIPAEYQKITTFSTGITTASKNQSEAQKLIDYLTSNDEYVLQSIQDAGLEAIR